ncbi:hypothetical protein D3C87_545340 [compost metagenome]
MTNKTMFPGLDLNNIDSVRKHIFNATYLYAIPGYYRYSKEYNEKVGHLSTGSKKGDADALSEYVNVGGTITDILKLYEKGADILMQHREDLVTIYEVLVAHIGFWSTYIDRDPNVKDAPLQSLYLMSDYCKTIQAQVMGFKPKVADVPQLKRMSSLFGGIVGAEELFNPGGVGNTVQETAPIMGRIERLLAERNQNKK